MKPLKWHIGLILLFLLSTTGNAQDLAYNGNPDESFGTARKLAFSGNHTAARDTLAQILTRYPGYTDVKCLLGRTYSWAGDYDEARKHFNRITSSERFHKDSWVAAINNERFAHHLHLALGLANKALYYLKEDEELEALKAVILSDIANGVPPIAEIKEGAAIAEVPEKRSNRLGFFNSVDLFDRVYDPMYGSGVEYQKETAAGTLLPRITYGHRFNAHGLQYELDVYPKLSERVYAYFNYGYSNASIFPRHRMGSELYATFSGGIEASMGYRYLEFETARASIYTGSLGWYKGAYYASFRPYLNVGSQGSAGVSATLMLRKYLNNPDTYLGVQLGYGFAPELLQLRSSGTMLSESLLFIESQQLRLAYQFAPRQRPSIYRATLGITRQELAFESGRYFWALTAGLHYYVSF